MGPGPLEHRAVAHWNEQVRGAGRDDARAQPGQAEVGRFEPERRGQRRGVGLHRAERRRRLRHADRADRGPAARNLDRQHLRADLLPERGAAAAAAAIVPLCGKPPPGAQRVVPGGEELRAGAVKERSRRSACGPVGGSRNVVSDWLNSPAMRRMSASLSPRASMMSASGLPLSGSRVKTSTSAKPKRARGGGMARRCRSRASRVRQGGRPVARQRGAQRRLQVVDVALR